MADSFLHTEVFDGDPIIKKKHHQFVVIAIIAAAAVAGAISYVALRGQSVQVEPLPTPSVASSASNADAMKSVIVSQLNIAAADVTSSSMTTAGVSAVKKFMGKPAPTPTAAEKAAIVRQLQMSEI
ncbi:MAG: hypothetical protein KGJ33_02795 [Patescibacteria group bacterium]|nr:hypothetical protein [Patescibacteria group bacterium]